MIAIAAPFGIELLDVITVLVGVAAFLAVYLAYTSGLQRDPMRGRIKALQERREALKAGFMTTRKRQDIIKKVDGVDAMRKLTDKVNLGLQADKVRLKLAAAGVRSRDAVIVFSFFKIVAPILIGVLAGVAVFGFQMLPNQDFVVQVASVIGAFAAGFFLPDLYLKNLTDRRQDSIRKALPDALDLMVICAEAGLTLDAAMSRVAKESGKQSVELADEFGLTSIELGFLSERRQALQNLAARVDLPMIRGVVTTLIQSEKYGTPLAQSLRVLSAEFRNERMMRAEEKAARLPALMTVPLIMFILPCIFIVILGPATCRLVDSFITKF